MPGSGHIMCSSEVTALREENSQQDIKGREMQALRRNGSPCLESVSPAAQTQYLSCIKMERQQLTRKKMGQQWEEVSREEYAGQK